MLKRLLSKAFPRTMDKRDPAEMFAQGVVCHLATSSVGQGNAEFEALPRTTQVTVRDVVSRVLATQGSAKATAPDGSQVWACGTRDLVDWGVETPFTKESIARGVFELGGSHA